MSFPCACGRRLYGLNECCCPTCGRHFGGVDGFDMHRSGPVDDRRCLDPATLVDRHGKARLVAAERVIGVVWVKPARARFDSETAERVRGGRSTGGGHPGAQRPAPAPATGIPASARTGEAAP